ncbi:MAG: multicopper oxidase MmcO [Mycobacterium sp.]
MQSARCNPADVSMSRRHFLAAGGLVTGGLLLAGCGSDSATSGEALGPTDAAVVRAEAQRRRSGRTVDYILHPHPTQIDLGGPVVSTWAYSDTVPGPIIRAQPGDELRIQVNNALPADTSVHWHGLTIDNNMDGVPPVTQKAIPAGSAMLYRYVVPEQPGTYWYHPHVGLQEDTGMYGPLIVDDPSEAGAYDVEFVFVLDDWIDGVNGQTPASFDAALRSGKAMGGSSSGGPTGPGSPLGAGATDVTYPYYLINGKIPSAPVTLTAKPGQRARFRLINSAAGTGFQVALGGHHVTVTHTDGYPVKPVTVDTLVLGIAERYDVTVTLGDGAFPFTAIPLGAPGQAMAVVRTGSGAAPEASARPAELTGQLLPVDLSTLAATAAVQTPTWAPDVTHELVLAGGMSNGYTWTINGRAYPDFSALPVRQGQRTRLLFTNRTRMFHPMHLHGHTFQVRANPDGTGPRKDTVNVLPMHTVVADFIADNPGQWVVHCHNLYHQENGMMTVLSYRT